VTCMVLLHGMLCFVVTSITVGRVDFGNSTATFKRSAVTRYLFFVQEVGPLSPALHALSVERPTLLSLIAYFCSVSNHKILCIVDGKEAASKACAAIRVYLCSVIARCAVLSSYSSALGTVLYVEERGGGLRGFVTQSLSATVSPTLCVYRLLR
jgi:hypothetical protein